MTFLLLDYYYCWLVRVSIALESKGGGGGFNIWEQSGDKALEALAVLFIVHVPAISSVLNDATSCFLKNFILIFFPTSIQIYFHCSCSIQELGHIFLCKFQTYVKPGHSCSLFSPTCQELVLQSSCIECLVVECYE